MIHQLRQQFNANYKPSQYEGLFRSLEQEIGHPCLFRIAETPVFVPKSFKEKLLKGCEDAFDAIISPDFLARTQGALTHHVPNENKHTHFMQIDFGVCEDENGELNPKMIEIQGFPSLYCFQSALADAFRANYDIPSGFNTTFGGLSKEAYLEELRQVIVAGHRPENVVLLEVEPEKQGTNIDFYATSKYLGIKTLCLTKLRKSGKDLYYEDENGKKIEVHRIYNRVIFDELDKKSDLKFDFNFSDEINAEWAGHPNWFFRISKYTLPLLRSQYVPKSYFLNELTSIPDNLEDFVLKPLFSFAGMGVKINVTKEDLEVINDPENYILQEKVNYAPVIPTPNIPAKCEIRMMVTWKDGDARPKVVNNICRLSKGEMIGVRYNKDKDWVGGTVCFFED